MKKRILIITLSIALTTLGLISWQTLTYSQETSKHDDICDGNRCCVSYNEAMDALEIDWQNNLQQLIDQEKPTSKMVDDAYENLRTYRCWLEYVCEAVEYSGHAKIQSVVDTGITSQHIGKIQGCVAPQNLQFENEWNSFVQTLKKITVLGVPLTYNPDDFYTNGLNFFPQCMTDRQHNNDNPKLAEVVRLKQKCMESVELRFGCPADADQEEYERCLDQSTALAQMETVLKKSNAEQKSRALEDKFRSILPKMHTMETHAEYLKNKLMELDLRFECYAGNCT
jgi:hypothetical protein